MSNFEWKLEEDSSSPAQRDAPRRRRIHPVLFGLLVLTAIAVAVTAIITTQADNTFDAIKEDVLVTHRLIEQAVRDGDLDLFDTFIAHDQQDWVEAQHDTIERGIYIDRAALGFHLQSPEPTNVEVELADDLQSATVRSTFLYAAEEQEIVSLQHIALYRLIKDRWTRIAPNQPFWEEDHTYDGRSITFTYPERDNAIAQQLAQGFGHIVEELCRDSRCGQPSVNIDLKSEPDVVINLADSLGFQQPTFPVAARRMIHIALPTPTLIGLPIDEPGFQAMRRFYFMQTVKSLLRQSFPVDYSTSLIDAATNRILVDQGLRTWATSNVQPLKIPQQDIAFLCVDNAQLDMSVLQYHTADRSWSTISVARKFVSITPRPSGTGFVLRERIQNGNLIQTYITYWHRGVESPIFKVIQNVNIAPFTLQSISPFEHYLTLTFPDYLGSPTQAVIIDLNQCDESGCNSSPVVGSAFWSPSETRTIISHYRGTLLLGDSAGQSLTELGNGIVPFWIDDDTLGYLHLSSLQDALVSGTGGEILIASLSILDEPIDATLPAGTLQVSANTLFPLNKLRAFLQDVEGNTPLLPNYLMVDPIHPNQLWFNMALYHADDVSPTLAPIGGMLFVVDRQTGEISFQIRFDRSWAHATPSPDRRRLLIYNHGNVTTQDSLSVFDVEQRRFEYTLAMKTHRVDQFETNTSWSSDGQWLFVLDNGVLTLLEPASGYQYSVTPQTPGCASAVWLNRES